MKKGFVFTMAFCLLSLTLAITAQNKAPVFEGDWKLDTTKSQLGERSRIESMTMKVSQTADKITYERKVKQKEGENGGRGRGGRRFRGAGSGVPIVYKLDGSETSTDIDRGRITGKVTNKADLKDGNLILTTIRIFETPRGERKTKTTETWSLTEEGKVLTVSSETETPRGTRSSKMVFTKA